MTLVLGPFSMAKGSRGLAPPRVFSRFSRGGASGRAPHRRCGGRRRARHGPLGRLVPLARAIRLRARVGRVQVFFGGPKFWLHKVIIPQEPFVCDLD